MQVRIDRSIFGATLAALLLLVACSTPSAPAHSVLAVDSAGVGAVRDRLAKNLVSGDASAVMADYSDSAVFIGQGAPTIANRGPMTDFLKTMYAATKVSRFDIHPLRVVGHDGMLMEMGTQYEVAAEQGKPAQEAWGRYMLTWVKSSTGQWQVVFDAAIDDSAHAVGKTP